MIVLVRNIITTEFNGMTRLFPEACDNNAKETGFVYIFVLFLNINPGGGLL